MAGRFDGDAATHRLDERLASPYLEPMLSRLLITLLALVTGLLAPGVSAPSRAADRHAMEVGALAVPLAAHKETGGIAATGRFAARVVTRAGIGVQRIPAHQVAAAPGVSLGIDRAHE